jgi:hypothetical protein
MAFAAMLAGAGFTSAQELPAERPRAPASGTRGDGRDMSLIRDLELASRRRALGSRLPFANPPEIRSGGGRLETTLAVRYTFGRIGDDVVHLRSYNGLLVGPTLRVRPRDVLAATLKAEAENNEAPR